MMTAFSLVSIAVVAMLISALVIGIAGASARSAHFSLTGSDVVVNGVYSTNGPTTPPKTLSLAQMNAIPTSSAELSSTELPSVNPHLIPDACTIYAYDVSIVRKKGRKASVHGWQRCTPEIWYERTQVCLYKLHHFVLFRKWEEDGCGAKDTDADGTFQPVGYLHTCTSGDGTYYAVVYGSYFDPTEGKRFSGDVRSENDRTLPSCN